MVSALAWTLERHPTRYGQVHAWLTEVRADQPVPGSHHDTRAWVRLAADPRVFPRADSAFERVRTVWQQGLRLPD